MLAPAGATDVALIVFNLRYPNLLNALSNSLTTREAEPGDISEFTAKRVLSMEHPKRAALIKKCLNIGSQTPLHENCNGHADCSPHTLFCG